MTTQHDPTLLQYARFYGIAASSTNPRSYLDEEYELKPRATLPAKDKSSLTTCLEVTRLQFESDIETERLDVSRKDAHFLSTIIRNGTGNDRPRWEEILPPVRRMDSLKLETPLLSSDAEFALTSSMKQGAIESDVMQLLSTENPHGLGNLPEMSERLQEVIGQCKAQIMSEKLHCSKDSLSFIPRGKRSASRADMETYFQDMMVQRRKALAERNQMFLEPYPFDQAHLSDRSQSLPSPITPDVLKSHHQREVSGECLVGTALSSAIHLPAQDTDVRMKDSTAWSPRTPEQYNRSKGAMMSNDIPLDDAISDQDSIAHSEPAQHRSAPNLVYIAQAALETGEANFQRDGNGITSPMAIFTPVSSDPDPVSMIEVSTLQQEIPERTGMVPIQSNGHVIQEDQPQGLHAYSERGTAHDPIEIYSDKEDHEERMARSESGDFTAPRTHPDKDDVILLEMSVSTLEREPVKRTSKAASDPFTHSVKPEDRNLHLRHLSGIQRSPTRPCCDSNSNTGLSTLGLGSLSRFMETRGISKPEGSLKSPYFCMSTTEKSPNQQARRPQTPPHQPSQINASPESFTVSDFTLPDTVRCRKEDSEQLLLFLSTALLKTHVRFVQLLETRTHPPTIIYRDYDQATRAQPGSMKGQPELLPGTQHEANVIISPTTGIILTTSHAVTQLYLPGHKPSDPRLNTIKGINSPLRERIFRLTPRYEQIYVIICHGGAKTSQQRGNPGSSKLDKRTMTALASLSAFCSSLSHESTITPLIIPSFAESLAEWVLALAYKHAFQLPGPLQKQQKTPNSVQHNTTPTQKHVLHEEETRWELFLRSMGLNPFAARVVLDAIPASMESELSNHGFDDYKATSLRAGERGPSVLSAFIEMTPEDRKERYDVWLGCRVLKRLEEVIDADLQCGWALDYEPSGIV